MSQQPVTATQVAREISETVRATPGPAHIQEAMGRSKSGTTRSFSEISSIAGPFPRSRSPGRPTPAALRAPDPEPSMLLPPPQPNPPSPGQNRSRDPDPLSAAPSVMLSGAHEAYGSHGISLIEDVAAKDSERLSAIAGQVQSSINRLAALEAELQRDLPLTGASVDELVDRLFAPLLSRGPAAAPLAQRSNPF